MDKVGIPVLYGARPLENGRLALAFRVGKKHEVRVYDLWSDIKKRRDGGDLVPQFFDLAYFKTAYLYGQRVCWGDGHGWDMAADFLYDASEVVEEDFQCLR